MVKLAASFAGLLVVALTGVNAQAPLYGQCGGWVSACLFCSWIQFHIQYTDTRESSSSGWTGATTCVSGAVCTYSNEWYSQCLPGTAVTTSKAPTPTTTPSTGGCLQAADGFASLNGGTTGGAGGTVVTVTTQADLAKYASASGKYVIKVKGKITISPKGTEIKVASDKTIIGLGTTGEIYQGGFNLNKVSNVIIRNLKIGRSHIYFYLNSVFGGSLLI